MDFWGSELEAMVSSEHLRKIKMAKMNIALSGFSRAIAQLKAGDTFCQNVRSYAFSGVCVGRLTFMYSF